MTGDSDGRELDLVRAAAKQVADLRLLILFGSRARGDVWRDSDWDFAYRAGPAFVPERFIGDLSRILDTDRIDLVDLDRSGGQLRYRIAREGRVMHARDEAEYAAFWLDAVSFWCDAHDVLDQGYDGLLTDLKR